MNIARIAIVAFVAAIGLFASVVWAWYSFGLKGPTDFQGGSIGFACAAAGFCIGLLTDSLCEKYWPKRNIKR